jgi:hypothetical protein
MKISHHVNLNFLISEKKLAQDLLDELVFLLASNMIVLMERRIFDFSSLHSALYYLVVNLFT